MKKNNKIKKSVSMLAFLFVCALSVILSSCSDELDIQQSYPFKVETMPVPKDIVRGQTVEIRCELKAEGKFDGTIYTIRYFQHDGKGSLRMENGTVFQPNDRYLSENEKLRLYYTSASTETQTLTVVVEDNFGKSYEMEFSFNDTDEEEEFARTFVINYQGDKAFIRQLSDINPEECLFDFEGRGNSSDIHFQNKQYNES